MKAEEYNAKQISDGNLTQEHIVQMVQLWQKENGLEEDGYCGPKTQQAFSVETTETSDKSTALGILCLQVAAEEMEAGAREVGGNNQGEFVAKYKNRDPAATDMGAWCAAFCSWVIEEACRRAGIDMPFRRSEGAKALWKNCGKAGSFVGIPSPGDLACWDRGDLLPSGNKSWAGHIGFVESVKLDSSENLVEFTTIEGNVGGYNRTGGAPVRRFTHRMHLEKRMEGFSRMPETSIPVA
tara:strand:- start:6 stop:722 length:717 start_codon:yes stop_codon:yes gene_type:complete